jgi:hypothetical protein
MQLPCSGAVPSVNVSLTAVQIEDGVRIPLGPKHQKVVFSVFSGKIGLVVRSLPWSQFHTEINLWMFLPIHTQAYP